MAFNAVKAMPPSERYSSSSISISIPSIQQTTHIQPEIIPSESETYLDYYGNPYGPIKYPTSNQAAELIE